MENKIINIDSIFRNKTKYPNSSHFVYELPYRFSNIEYIKMSSCEIPNVYYSFSSKRCNLSFSLTYNLNKYTITISEGNYTSSTLVTQINSKLDIINSSANTDFALTFNGTNGKMTFSSTKSALYDFSNDSTIYDSLGKHLGFQENNYSGTSITGDCIANLAGENYIFMKINDYDNIINDRNGSVFAKIIFDTNKFNVNFDDSGSYVTKEYIFRQPRDLTRFEIKLEDRYGQVIDMKNYDFSLTLEVGQIYSASYKNWLEKTGNFTHY